MFKRWFHKTRKPALDPNDVCCEIYNPGSEEITFRSVHPNKLNHYFRHPRTGLQHPPEFWEIAICKPGEWAFLPHQRYTGSVPSGNEAIEVLKIFGDRMFKGEKLPSRPEVTPISTNHKAVY